MLNTVHVTWAFFYSATIQSGRWGDVLELFFREITDNELEILSANGSHVVPTDYAQ
jgi:hypothetical protein